MFRCAFCRKTVAPRTPCHRIVIASRQVYYPERQTILKHGKPVGKVINRPIGFLDEKGKWKLHYPEDPGGCGWEIEREVNACPDCAHKREKEAA